MPWVDHAGATSDSARQGVRLQLHCKLGLQLRREGKPPTRVHSWQCTPAVHTVYTMVDFGVPIDAGCTAGWV